MTYFLKLLRLYKLGNKTSKKFNNYIHSNMQLNSNNILSVSRKSVLKQHKNNKIVFKLSINALQFNMNVLKYFNIHV